MNFQNAAKSIAALQRIEAQLGDAWVAVQKGSNRYRPDLIRDDDMAHQSQTFLSAFLHAMQKSPSDDVSASSWAEVRGMLDEMSSSRAQQGFTPSETASFVFSLKE